MMKLILGALLMSVSAHLVSKMLGGDSESLSIFAIGVSWCWLLLGGALTHKCAVQIEKQLRNTTRLPYS